MVASERIALAILDYVVTTDEIRDRIEAGLPDSQAVVTGDGHHFRAEIVSPAFSGLSRIQQHQLVNQIFAGELGDRIHALSLKTTPRES